MSNFSQFEIIERKKIGLRVGTDVEGAAYAMSDFGDNFNKLSIIEKAKWLKKPNICLQIKEEWDNHLYNTIWKISSLANDKFKLLIVDKAGPSGERYNAQDGKGDKKTFAKTNRLPSDSKKMVEEKEFDPNEINEIQKWILAKLSDLSQPSESH